MPTPAAATLQQFKEHLDKTGALNDAELAGYLVSATHAAETDTKCGVGPIVQRQLVRRVEVAGGYVMLPVTPAVSLVSFVGVRGAATYAVADLDLDTDTGIVRAEAGYLAPGAYDVTYLAGRAEVVEDVDDDISLAVCIIGKHLWETQRGRNSRPGVLGHTSGMESSEDRVPSGFLVPHRAASLLLGARQWVAVG